MAPEVLMRVTRSLFLDLYRGSLQRRMAASIDGVIRL